jgi:hypothetical protein
MSLAELTGGVLSVLPHTTNEEVFEKKTVLSMVQLQNEVSTN